LLATLALLAEILPIPRFFAGIRNTVASVCNSTRIGRAIFAFLRHFFGSIARAVHVLWLQIVGCFFALFALTCGNAAVQEYRHYLAGTAARSRPLLAAFMTLMFAYFAISSFFRARKRERSQKQISRAA
jgi:hypothetical protein